MPSVEVIDITALSGVQGAWSMEDDFTDRSGNGFDIDVNITNARFASLQGKRGGDP
jgi:hypothetical protein